MEMKMQHHGMMVGQGAKIVSDALGLEYDTLGAQSSIPTKF